MKRFLAPMPVQPLRGMVDGFTDAIGLPQVALADGGSLAAAPATDHSPLAGAVEPAGKLKRPSPDELVEGPAQSV